jgi:cation diffusion facilitator family transporter
MALFGVEPGGMSAQRRATAVSVSAASFLMIIKIVAGIAGGSVAVLASAIDSMLDMAVSVFNFFAIKKAEEHPSDLFPYGKGKIQAIAGVIEGTVIVLSGLYIVFEAIVKIVRQENISYAGWSLVVMLFSFVLTWGLVKYLLRISKETGNIVIKADALRYQTNLFSNGAVIAALAAVYITGWGWVDALFGLGIGFISSIRHMG